MSRFEWVSWGTIAGLVLSFALMTFVRADGIVSVGGSVTEIVYALGEGDRLVARDTTSTFPDQVTELPDVGYKRRLSPEGVLTYAPDLLLMEEGSGPPETIALLQSARVDVISIPEDFSAQGVTAKIKAVGVALGAEDAATELAARVGQQLSQAATTAAAHPGPSKRVMFVLSTQGGRIMASGTGTAADAIITMAGGENALSAFEGYKPLSDEAISVAAPDVILMMDRGGDHGATRDDLFALPAIATTPAAETQALVQMDGLLLLGFGPRTADAISSLTAALYPQ